MSRANQAISSTSDRIKLFIQQITSIKPEEKYGCRESPEASRASPGFNPNQVNASSIETNLHLWQPNSNLNSSSNDASATFDHCNNPHEQQQQLNNIMTLNLSERQETRERALSRPQTACRQQYTIALLGYLAISTLMCARPFIVAATQQETPEQEARAGQWSLPSRPSLFSIIRFPNEECFDSSNQSGTCYTAFECKLLGGQPSSPCAAGFGSCCIVSRTCHVTTREKVVYFKNPSYPSADSDEKFCDLTVEMSDINVCQLRLDFLDFQLDPPTNGACKDDYMEISASGMPPQTVPRLCGLNRNQHRK